MLLQVYLQIPGFLENLFAGGALVSWPLQGAQVLSLPVNGQVGQGASLEAALIAGKLVLLVLPPPFSNKSFTTLGQMLLDCYLGPFDNVTIFAFVLFSSRS